MKSKNNKPLLKLKKKIKRKNWIMTRKNQFRVVSLSILKNTPFSEQAFVTDSFMAGDGFLLNAHVS